MRTGTYLPSAPSRRQVVAGAAGLLAAPLAFGTGRAADLAGRSVVISDFGGQTADTKRAIAFAPFENDHGAEIVQVPLHSAAGLARMQAEAGNPQLDMYQFSGGQELVAKELGLTQPITPGEHWAAIPDALKDPQGHWVATGITAQGIIYRTDKMPFRPTSYRDFLRPELKGHIAFPTITNGYGTDFLVMLARTYGGGENDIDPGLEAQKQIFADASVFRGASDVITLFAQSDVWIVPYDKKTAFRLNEAGIDAEFVVPEEGGPASLVTCVLPDQSRNADVCSRVVDRLLSPPVQARIAQELKNVPSNPNTVLPEAVARTTPSVSDLAILDRAAINANRPIWTERWNKEVVEG